MCLGEIGEVTALPEVGRAEVLLGARTAVVSLLTLDETVATGDLVLVHAGFALARLTPEQAAEALDVRETITEGRPS